MFYEYYLYRIKNYKVAGNWRTHLMHRRNPWMKHERPCPIKILKISNPWCVNCMIQNPTLSKFTIQNFYHNLYAAGTPEIHILQ